MQKFAYAAAMAAILSPVAAVAQQAPLSTIGVSPLPGAWNLWPWMAMGTIVALLAIISLGTRRHSPFGNLL